MPGAEDGVPWLEQLIPLDPLLIEPLDLHASRARRRIQMEALLRELGLEHRAESWERSIADSTWRLVWTRFPPLVEARERVRIAVHPAAFDVAGASVDTIGAAQGLYDFGWSHLEVPGGMVRDVLAELRELYVNQMGNRVLTMLRRWEKRGWLSDVGA